MFKVLSASIQNDNCSARDKNQSLRDPFVKVYLLPDEGNRQESRVVEKTLAPHFDQTFMFANVSLAFLHHPSVVTTINFLARNS